LRIALSTLLDAGESRLLWVIAYARRHRQREEAAWHIGNNFIADIFLMELGQLPKRIICGECQQKVLAV
jgi:hypothetical protein